MLVWLICPHASLADEPEAGSIRLSPQLQACLSRPACATTYREARQLSRQGELAAAESKYLEIHHSYPAPEILYNIARIFHRQEKFHNAIEYYQQFIHYNGYKDSNQVSLAEKHLVEARSQATVTNPQPPGQPPVGALIAPQLPVMAKNSEPLYRRGWFWGVVTAGVVVAGAVTVGVILGTAPPSVGDDALRHQPF